MSCEPEGTEGFAPCACGVEVCWLAADDSASVRSVSTEISCTDHVLQHAEARYDDPIPSRHRGLGVYGWLGRDSLKAPGFQP